MSFIAPEWLYLLVAVVGLGVAYVVLQLFRRRYAVRFTNVDLLSRVAPRAPGWRRHLTAAIVLLAMVSLVVALARPAREEQVARERATVVIALDTSLSMEATDVSPNRFEAAKDAAKAFVEAVPPGINLGLVHFAGTATIRVPPTLLHDDVTTAIDDLELDYSTAIGDAIVASLAAVETVPASEDGTPVPASVVLLSDGDTQQGTPNEDAAEQARGAGVPVSTIAFGTEDATVTDPSTGEVVAVPVDEEALQDIAETTGGSFFRAVTGEELRAIYEDVGSSVGHEQELRELTTWFVGLGLGLLLAASALSLVWFSRLP